MTSMVTPRPQSRRLPILTSLCNISSARRISRAFCRHVHAFVNAPLLPRPSSLKPPMASRRVTRSMNESDESRSAPAAKQVSPARIPSNPDMSPLACIPTRLEQILLLIYPATLILGSLFSILNPVNRAAPYSADSQSHPPSHAPSYFARKSNIFNRYFVKIGWFWTSLAFFVFVATHSLRARRASASATSDRAVRKSTINKLHALLRYGLITCLWAAMTQWCFGPPLIDRGFRFTGGQCQLLAEAESPHTDQEMSAARKVATHAACKAVGGSWKGGHDISGHVFILILGSAMLWLEIMPIVLSAAGLGEQRRIRTQNGTVVSADVVEPEPRGSARDCAAAAVSKAKDDTNIPSSSSSSSSDSEQGLGIGVRLALAVAILSWWMLLMTAAYFHTWFEKFTGFLVAFTAIGAVYFAPREIPALRRVVGMPGL